MDEERMAIGELAHRTGLPVKTIRFYSDEGLLPPADRTEAGYRLFDANDLVRLELIVTLREAGLDLGTIRKVLQREMTLARALELRLYALESHITSLQRVAAAIKATLRAEPDQADLRRLHKVTQLSNEERKALIERFYEQVSEGIPMDEDWKHTMIAASTPSLPDDPTKDQLDAWIELSEIVKDPGFVEAMRAAAEQTWTSDYDHSKHQPVIDAVQCDARSAIDAGIEPDAFEAQPIVERYLEGMADVAGKAVDADFRAEFYRRFAEHDPRASRYWELVNVIAGRPAMAGPVEEWDWIARAVVAHLG